MFTENNNNSLEEEEEAAFLNELNFETTDNSLVDPLEPFKSSKMINSDQMPSNGNGFSNKKIPTNTNGNHNINNKNNNRNPSINTI